MSNIRLALALSVMMSPLTALTAVAEEPAGEPTLKQIMQGLRDNVSMISNGMFTDDLGLVAQGAEGIAHHDAIPADQVKLIVAELGPEMPAFKAYDERVHQLSVSMIAAAGAQDRDRIYADYQQLINGCLACHTPYKERVAAALEDSARPD